MNTTDRAKALRQLGWRTRTTGEYQQALKHFQRGWALGPALSIDGHAGPHTDAALAMSQARFREGKPTASKHFSFEEFACKCNGRYSSCPRIWVVRELLGSLEELREKCYPGGLTPISGCRCNAHNKAVGGAKSSQHMLGGACDIPPVVSRQKMAALGLFAGIGYNLSSGKVSHVDRRDAAGNNTTDARRGRPTVWIYHR